MVRGTLILLTAGICAAALAMAVPAPAANAAVRANALLVRVLNPRPHATVRGRAVKVRLRVAAGVRSISAQIGSRKLRGTFVRRARNGLRVATLRVGRPTGLHYGVNRLEIRARDRRGAGDYDVAEFALVRRSPRLLSLATPSHCLRRAMLHLRLASKRVVVSARVNGRRIFVPASARVGGRKRVLELDADDRLRFGRNSVQVTAVDRVGGRFAVKRRTIMIGRTAPIPGAGHGRRVLTGRSVRLDAGSTRAARRHSSVRYRWRIVRKPRGSKAKLFAATTRRPRFVPDRPGVYRLKMTVVVRVGGRGRASQASPVAASDTTMLLAAPDDNGIGVAVNTMDNGGVTVGGQHYAPPDPSKPLQLVVLDRSTLEPISNGSIAPNRSFAGDDAGTQSLANAVSQLNSYACPGYPEQQQCAIAIIATRAQGNGRAPLTDAGALANLNGAVAALGGRAIPATAALSAASCAQPTPVCGGFSVIGVPGYPAGAGTINPGLAASVDGHNAGGALTGYLQLSETTGPTIVNLFVFIQGDHVAFDTTASGTSPTQAVIQVGSAKYTSTQLVSPVNAGAYVLVLDAGTLAFRQDGTFGLRGGPVGPIVSAEDQMAALLNKYANDPSALVFVQSIGSLARWDTYLGNTDLPNGWNQIGAALQALGGHSTLFNALAGNYPRYDGTYAQVGPAGPSAASWSKTASQAATGTPGQLAGTLARNNSAQFYAEDAAGAEKFDDGLTLLAYHSPTPWPLRGDARHRAALQCIASQVTVGNRSLAYPIEDNYTNAAYKSAWGNLQEDVDALDYSDLTGPQCNKSKFNQTEFKAVKTQLDKEFTAVAVVWGLIDALKQPYADEAPEDTVAVVAAQIRQSLPTPQGATTSYDPLAIGEEVLYVVGAIASVTGQEEIPIALELIAAGMGLVDDTTLNSDGTPELQTPISDLDVASFAQDLHDRFQAAKDHFDQIGDILVGDWYKLSTAAGNATLNGPWYWNNQEKGGSVRAALQFAATRLSYTALFPKAYPVLLRGENGDSTLGISGDASQYTCWYYPYAGGGDPFHDQTDNVSWLPFQHTQSWGGVNPNPVTAAGPNEENWVYAGPVNSSDAIGQFNAILYPWSANVLPSADLLHEMFVNHVSGVAAPPLQPLEFVLSISDQLQVFHILRTSSTFHTDDGEPELNRCVGSISGWPGGL